MANENAVESNDITGYFVEETTVAEAKVPKVVANKTEDGFLATAIEMSPSYDTLRNDELGQDGDPQPPSVSASAFGVRTDVYFHPSLMAAGKLAPFETMLENLLGANKMVDGKKTFAMDPSADKRGTLWRTSNIGQSVARGVALTQLTMSWTRRAYVVASFVGFASDIESFQQFRATVGAADPHNDEVGPTKLNFPTGVTGNMEDELGVGNYIVFNGDSAKKGLITEVYQNYAIIDTAQSPAADKDVTDALRLDDYTFDQSNWAPASTGSQGRIRLGPVGDTLDNDNNLRTHIISLTINTGRGVVDDIIGEDGFQETYQGDRISNLSITIPATRAAMKMRQQCRRNRNFQLQAFVGPTTGDHAVLGFPQWTPAAGATQRGATGRGNRIPFSGNISVPKNDPNELKEFYMQLLEAA